MKKSPFQRDKTGISYAVYPRDTSFVGSHSDKYDFGFTMLNLGKVTLYIMGHTTSDIITGVDVPRITNLVNTGS